MDKIIMLTNRVWHKYHTYLPFAIACIGSILLVFQWLYNRSFWHDEASLALNLINRNFYNLLQPLDYKQVTPPLFLILSKGFCQIFGYKTMVFKLIPLFAGLASIWFFKQLLQNIGVSVFAACIALCFLIFNYSFLYYSSELKQYITDCLLFIGCLTLVTSRKIPQKLQLLLFSILGVFCIGLSHVAPIILCSVGFFWIGLHVNAFKENKYLVFSIILFWSAVFGIYYYLMVYNHPTRDFQVNFWHNVNAFAPMHLFSIAFYGFVLKQFLAVTNSAFSISYLGYVFVLIGIIGFSKNKKRGLLIGLVCFLPFILHIIASGFALYPFSHRLTFYLIPGFLLFLAYTLSVGLQNFTKKKYASLVYLSCLFVLPSLLATKLAKQFPVEKQDLKACINFIQSENIDTLNTAYLYYGAKRAWYFYETINQTPQISVIKGSNCSKNMALCIDELKNIKVDFWLVFSHVNNSEASVLINNLQKDTFIIVRKIEKKGAFMLHLTPKNS